MKISDLKYLKLIPGKGWSKNKLTCENAISQSLYGSCTLRVMGSWYSFFREIQTEEKLKISRRRKGQFVVSCQVVTDPCCGLFGGYLLQFHLASDWSRNNKHSRNFLSCSRFTEKTVSTGLNWESLGMRLYSPPIRKALWCIIRHSERSTCKAPAVSDIFFRFGLTISTC